MCQNLCKICITRHQCNDTGREVGYCENYLLDLNAVKEMEVKKVIDYSDTETQYCENYYGA
jgi:hypothetical protein